MSPETRSLITTDGIRLDADVYYPPGNLDETYPVLLMRQPYGRSIASTVVYAHPSWYASQGYIVVIQDVRGRGTSEGEFRLFESEIEDGHESVNWAANLPRSNGKVGMYGFSYQGMTQIYAAIHRSPALKTICPAMLAYDLYSDWAYEGDVFCLQANLGWALQLATETARLQRNEAKFYKLRQASQNLPLSDRIPAYPDSIQTLAPESFYHDWIKRDRNDPYWQKLSPCSYLDQIADLPMLHIGGWFDTYLRGTLNLYQAMCDRDQAPQRLIIGPWAHLPWGRRAGSIDYGETAVSPCDRRQMEWFDYWLKGKGNLPNSLATWFEMGSNVWKSADRFTPTTEPRILTSHFSALTSPFSTLVHDPWRPIPSLGGHAGASAGRFDRASIDDRNDVLTYTSEALTQPITIEGSAEVAIDFHTIAKSIDLHVVLSEVLPDGRVFNLAQGVQKIPNACDRNQSHILLQAICQWIPASHALRLSIGLSNFPAFPVNAGDGNPLHESQVMDQAIVTLQVLGGTITLPSPEGVIPLTIASAR